MSTVSPTERRLDTGLPENELLRLYRQMVLIRRFEERAEEQYTRDRIGGYLHLNIGEEATVVGAHLRPARRTTTSSPATATTGWPSPWGRPVAGGDGRAVRQGDGRGPRARGLDAPPGRAAPLPGRVGHRGGLHPHRRRGRPGPGLLRPAGGRRCASSGTAPSATGAFHEAAQPGRPVAPALPLRDHQQRLRHGHLGRAQQRRAGAVQAGGGLQDARGSGWTGRTCWRCGRRRSACCAWPGTSASPPSWSASPTATGATRRSTPGRATAARRRSSSWRQRDPILLFGERLQERGLLSRGRRPARRRGRRPGGAGGDRLRPAEPRPRPGGPLPAHLRRGRPRSSSRRMAPGRPVRRAEHRRRAPDRRRRRPRTPRSSERATDAGTRQTGAPALRSPGGPRGGPSAGCSRGAGARDGGAARRCLRSPTARRCSRPSARRWPATSA